MLATRMRMVGDFGPFGSNPKTFTGADFFDGTAAKGMLVFKTAKTYTAFTPLLAANVEVLVVAGGGSPGHHNEAGWGGTGGGGAGGYLYDAAFAMTKVTTTIVVGAGAVAQTSQSSGNTGGNSSFRTLTAIGGGFGGCYWITAPHGGHGGSGGGGGGSQNSNGGNGTVGPPRQGYNGGSWTNDTPYGGAGGGGASALGGSKPSSAGGAGTSRFGFVYCTGGDGGVSAVTPATTIANTGMGGHGHYQTPANRTRAGGSGIVIVRWGGYSKNYNPTTDAVT